MYILGIFKNWLAKAMYSQISAPRKGISMIRDNFKDLSTIKNLTVMRFLKWLQPLALAFSLFFVVVFFSDFQLKISKQSIKLIML